MKSISKLKRLVALVLESGHRNRYSVVFDVFIEVLVLVNVVAVIVESFDSIYTAFKIPLDIFEIFTVTVFSIEFVLRMWISDIKYPLHNKGKSLKRFLLSPSALIDFLAIMPFFIPYWINIDLRHLRIIRLIRLMRVFKLAKYSQSIIHIGSIIREKKRDLLATFLLMFSVLILASSIMYYIERDAQPKAFPNILYAFWWGIITLTTVGYGDVYPITFAGKLTGGIVALIGVLIVAIPTGIISSSFVQKMEEAKAAARIREVRKKLKNAFYKKYIPELGTKVRRGQLSVDAVKVSLELSENDVYKIAEGKNDFRFRFKKIIQNGLLTDRLFLEYREINASYGTFTNRHSTVTLISEESLKKAGVGYLTYCMAEKLKCNYISNEFFGDESSFTGESFGDSGLEEEATFSFRQNHAYFSSHFGHVPKDFNDWKADLSKANTTGATFFLFNTFQKEEDSNTQFNLYYIKNRDLQNITPTVNDLEALNNFKKEISKNFIMRYGFEPAIGENKPWNRISETNIIYFIRDEIKADVIIIKVLEDYIINEKIFSLASVVADAIKESFEPKHIN